MTDKITGPEIEKIGRAVFGPLWPRHMAQAFDLHRHTITNWRTRGARRNVFCALLAAYVLRQRIALDEAEVLITEIKNP